MERGLLSIIEENSAVTEEKSNWLQLKQRLIKVNYVKMEV